MTALRDRDLPAARLTVESPVIMEFGYDDTLSLSKVALWYEDGEYVIRSLEYDVVAADEDRRAAVRKFLSNSIDYAHFISESDGATPDDVELALTIFRRITDITAHISIQNQPRRRGGLIGRMRGHRGDRAGQGWRLHRPAAQI